MQFQQQNAFGEYVSRWLEDYVWNNRLEPTMIPGPRDVSEHAARYGLGRQLLISQSRFLWPAARITLRDGTEQYSPVDIVQTLGMESKGIGEINMQDYFARVKVEQAIEIAVHLTESAGLRLTAISLNDADKIFANGVKDVLSKRRSMELAPTSEFLMGQSETVSGIRVTVHTESSGLELVYSPAYFIQYNQRFGGGLSTPVESTVGPGRYIFGAFVDGSPLMDDGCHDIPPNTDIHLTIA